MKMYFKSNDHKEYFLRFISKCKTIDRYHIVLGYLLGLAEVKDSLIFDFDSDTIIACPLPGALSSGQYCLLRLAYHLFTDQCPTAETSKGYDPAELKKYSVDEIISRLDRINKICVLEALSIKYDMGVTFGHEDIEF